MFKVGDLVEHSRGPGHRGIITEIISTRASGQPRIVKVCWFPPTGLAVKASNPWQLNKFEGEKKVSCLDLVKLSAAQ